MISMTGTRQESLILLGNGSALPDDMAESTPQEFNATSIFHLPVKSPYKPGISLLAIAANTLLK